MIQPFDPKSITLWSLGLFSGQLLLTHGATTTLKIAFSVTNYWELRTVISPSSFFLVFVNFPSNKNVSVL